MSVAEVSIIANPISRKHGGDWAGGDTLGESFRVGQRRSLDPAMDLSCLPCASPAISALGPLGCGTKAMHCPFGVISVFFFFIKYLIETPQPHLGLARVYLSQLDAFSSGIHPHLLDRPGHAGIRGIRGLRDLAIGSRSDWLVKDSRINALRRAMLNRISNNRSEDGELAILFFCCEMPRLVTKLSQALDLRQDVKRPQIYVYSKEVPQIRELSQGASFCGKGQWGMEAGPQHGSGC